MSNMHIYLFWNKQENYLHLTFLVSKHWASEFAQLGWSVGPTIQRHQSAAHTLLCPPEVEQTSPHVVLQDREERLVLLHLPKLSTNFPTTSGKVSKGVNQTEAYEDLVGKQTFLEASFWQTFSDCCSKLCGCQHHWLLTHLARHLVGLQVCISSSSALQLNLLHGLVPWRCSEGKHI